LAQLPFIFGRIRNQAVPIQIHAFWQGTGTSITYPTVKSMANLVGSKAEPPRLD
jgi:hypothetical protein